MKRQPDAVFIVDLRKEQLALREAQRLGLPVIALVDTNCDPDEVSYVVPGNDDAIRSCSLVIRAIADGIAAAKLEGERGRDVRGARRPAEEPSDEPSVAAGGRRRPRERHRSPPRSRRLPQRPPRSRTVSGREHDDQREPRQGAP